jgi:hypothetical protein
MNKLQRIYIPTLGRVNKQITYDAMPDWVKDMTYIVIQPQEEVQFRERYPNSNIKVLPAYIKGICATRDWLIKDGGDDCYGMIDDDITFWKRNVDRTTGKKNADKSNEAFTDTDWKEMIQWVEDKWNQGYTIVGLNKKGLPPANKEESINCRVMQSFWINGKNILINELVWELDYVEDIHFILQNLRMGRKTIVSDKFLYECGEYFADGGCQTAGRTMEDNKNMYRLAELYPNIIQFKNEWIEKQNGMKYQKHTIQFKKAYNPYYGRVMNTFW